MHMRFILFIILILAIVAAILFFFHLIFQGQKVGAMFTFVAICFLIMPAFNSYCAYKGDG